MKIEGGKERRRDTVWMGEGDGKQSTDSGGGGYEQHWKTEWGETEPGW